MPLLRLSSAVLFGSLCCTTTNSLTAYAQAPPTLDQVRQAYAPTQPPATVVLNGTFVSTDGSTVQNGNAQLTMGSDGSYTLSTVRGIGTNAEQRQIGATSGSACFWQDAAAAQHNVDPGNCIVPAWFLPEPQLLTAAGVTSEWAVSSVLTSGVPHLLCAYSTTPVPNAAQPATMDIELSPDTLLPASASFNLHPDGRSNIDIPVVISYQDYRLTNGVMIPFRIQKTLNGTLVLDVTVTTATAN